MTQAAQLAQYGANNVGLSFKNRIINGDMGIDQRNAGASVTANDGTYSVDRWKSIATVNGRFSMQQNAGSVTPPVGFTNYLGCTSTAATSVGASDFFQLRQVIEGFNFADMMWGTANAQPVTLSFWVRSSLTGTHGGSVFNAAGSRTYPFSFTINSANTWEYETITIPGDTTGTWVGATNGGGLQVGFNLGAGSSLSGTAGAWSSSSFMAPTGGVQVVGTNGATFYITGVQLEKGTVATSFDYLPYGTELALCQRYYEKSYNQSVVPGTATTVGMLIYVSGTDDAGNVIPQAIFAVKKRASPTVTFFNANTGASGTWQYTRSGVGNTNIAMTQDGATSEGVLVTFANTGAAYTVTKIVGQWTASAEL